jgi:CBS domain-containing protein
LGSKIITIDSNTNINDAIDIMLKSNIRRLFINDNIPYLVTGRVILNFIIENSISAIDVSNVSIDRLRIKGVVMDKDIDIKSVIVALLSQTPPSSVVINDRVITPMDIIKM